MIRLLLRLLLLLFPGGAWAHRAEEHANALAWNFEPWVVASLLASAALYGIGVRRLWRRAGRGRGVSVREAGCFGVGWSVLALALVSPVDTLGGELFSMHMVQHELLMVVAAPLFVLARPLEAWAWGMPQACSSALAAFARRPGVSRAWRTLTDPLGAWIFHGVALWAWHIPVLFEAALRHEGLHALQHATFLASALCFWWAVLQPRGRPDGAGLASLFTTMLHTGALGALLTFGPRAWYTAYHATERYGLSPVEDQQLGGLVMWVPGGLAYLVAAIYVIAVHLRGDAAPAARRARSCAASAP